MKTQTMPLEQLAAGCLRVPANLRDLEISGVECDSRNVSPGCLFVAVDGEVVDGHRFVQNAVDAGAVAIVGERSVGRVRRGGDVARDDHEVRRLLGELRVPYLRVGDARSALSTLGARFYGEAHRRLDIVGITGTKGKTTTAWVLDQILCHAGHKAALFGTVHNRIGERVSAALNTTPSSLELHKSFAELEAEGGSHAVLEVSSHGIVQRRVAGIEFDAAIFTNIAPEHLDYHKTFQRYFEAKAQLFTELSPGSFAILPREDPCAARLSAMTTGEVIWFGSDSQDGVEEVRVGPDGTSFRWKGYPVTTQLWGHHNLLNVLAAMAAAECVGVARQDIVAGVAAAVPPPGRLEPVANHRGLRVFVDYAHTDGSLDAVLRALRPVTPGRIITVFGCGGDRDREKRPRMGRVAEAGSDHIVVTSDNPRGEDPESILNDILSGLEEPDEAVFEPDRTAAIALGIRMARADDTVLIAGKGHETYQEFQGQRIHFDDREVARQFLHEGFALGEGLALGDDLGRGVGGN